jgi:cyclic beta-1,2-glucan synthetase
MSSDSRAPERTSAPAAACPALDSDCRWDDARALRGEILVSDALVAHAAELAEAHGEPSQAFSPGRLWQRFEAVERQINEAYAILTGRLRDGKDPSPAEEWLLDNSHVVQDQIREIREDLPRGYRHELPRIAAGVMRGHPRVYALCLDYLRHADARLELGSLADYVQSYQSKRPLTIGELWAVPIMLRLGLLLTVGTLAAAEARSGVRERADAWAARLSSARQTPLELSAVLVSLERNEPEIDGTFLVQLSRRLRESDDAALGIAFDWIALKSQKLGATPEELTRVQHLRQAADQVSVGNAITSMRAVAALDWNGFFERTSGVEALLRRDPLGSYLSTAKTTRDRYRHAVEMLARRSKADELAVAREVLALAEASHATAPGDRRRAHVGHYLVGDGRPELEGRIGYQPGLPQRFRRLVLTHPHTSYFGPQLALGLLALWLTLTALRRAGAPDWLAVVIGLLACLPASAIGLGLTEAIVTAVLKPRLLPRLDFERGIPPEFRTLVVVPCLIDGPATLATLLAELEVRSLANHDENLYFALLSDFKDASTREHAGDAELLNAALAGIAALNERHGRGEQRYFLLHRRRKKSETEGCYMGWDRKRGKLEELNRLLRGATDTSYSCVSAPTELLGSIRFVITLDADTDLPRETARELVAMMAHPLNAAELDPERQRVVSGYGIIQPRVGALPTSSRRSRFAALSSGPAGIDPYTTAVSDVYQDLFGEGSYTGKAIYDVDAFAGALAGRAPESALLSHDLFESFFARSALATDIELLDELPAAYEIHAARRHRWIRGDWQLVRWLWPRVPAASGTRRNDLRLLDVWKLVDNLRRSLVPVTIVATLVVGWFAGERFAPVVSALILAVLIAPLVAHAVLAASREASRVSGKPFAGVWGGLGRSILNVAVEAVFLLDEALLSLDAIGTALHRLVVRRRLLEWLTMRQSAAGGRVRLSARILFSSGLSVACAALLWLVQRGSLPWAAPLLVGWALAPALALWLSAPLAEPRREVGPEDALAFRLLARKTFRFFDHFVTEREHYLPPDNYQAEPRSVVAHRTSPTNIGLYLLSLLAAHDFGILTLRETCARLHRTFDTLDRLPRREGHLLNWYDTSTLAPLPPEYVSTVDSGNLAAYLWTWTTAARQLRHEPLLGVEPFLAVADALSLASAAERAAGGAALAARIATLETKVRTTAEVKPSDLVRGAGLLNGFRDAARGLFGEAEPDRAETRYWLGEAERTARETLTELGRIAPYLSLLTETEPVLDSSGGPSWSRLRQKLFAPATLDELVAALEGALPLLDDLDEVRAHAGHTRMAGVSRVASDFRDAIQRGLDECRRVLAELERAGERCGALADGMRFGFLYDEARELFAIGYNVSNARCDGSHYDLLASEARLSSLVAIAKGDAPQKHWFRLSRPRTRLGSEYSLLSWSGSMFEYLMPLLVTESRPHTLLREAMEGAVRRQRAYGAQQRVPWGISESAYNVMDLEMTYQYRAFGVPGLGLKAGLAEDLVVAPYATALAALVEPGAAAKNLRALAREGLDGKFGFFEAIDYSPGRLPPGRRGVVVRSFMAHHLGMTLVALDNVLHDRCMQRRFHADPRIKASELLLEERVPTGAPLLNVPDAALAAPIRHPLDLDASEHLVLQPDAPPRVHLLGHGALSTLMTSTGAGVLTWKGMDINRFREDAVFDPGGIYAYLRVEGGEKVWSAGHYPTRRRADHYDVAFFVDRVELRRRDGDIEIITEIVPSAEDAAEVRRYTLRNHGDEIIDLELTTYTELALAARAADVAHRAFSTLFIETEALPEQGALLAHRRPRSPEEPGLWVAQVLTPEDEGAFDFDFDTSREAFIGRAGSLERPLALTGRHPGLGRHSGAVLDPALVLQRRVRLAPCSGVRLSLATLMGETREEVLHLIAVYATAQTIPRAFELALADARVELRHVGVTAVEAHRFQRLLSAIVFPRPGLRASVDPLAFAGSGKRALWARGISGDLPIVAVLLDHPEFDDLVRELLLAHDYFRINGIPLDLVILNEEPSGYLQPNQEHALDVVRSNHAEGRLDQPGGIFLRRADQIPHGERQLLLATARVVLTASAGSLARQLKREIQPQKLPPALAPRQRPRPRYVPALERGELAFDNGLGGFSLDGREYVMFVDPATRTPAPWCNVMANPEFGCIVSESGSCFSWADNSQRQRLTPWSNDPLLDPSGEVLYLRDDEDGGVWSATPRPSGGLASYRVAHGQGYTRFSHVRGELHHELTVFVSTRERVRFQRLRIENRGNTRRKLSVYGVVEWVLGGSRESSALSVCTTFEAGARAIFATNPFAPAAQATAFFASTLPIQSFTADRGEFFGTPGSRRWPAALKRAQLSGRSGAGLDPLGALEASIVLEPGESREVTFLLGHAQSREEALATINRHPDADAVAAALRAVETQWDELCGKISVKTPDRSLDFLTNRWLIYQALSCRVWARSGFYQSSGAYGFRDQLQDVLCLLHAAPQVAREHLLRAAARQFLEGDVQHWWHPEAGDGVRTRCSDDRVWLPFAVNEYVNVTGDRAVLDEMVPFLTERVLGPTEHDLYSRPQATTETASLYEHCARALDCSLDVGARGLPKIGSGDWNDGMNRVGAGGAGESVWLAWFLARALDDFAPTALARRDQERAERWRAHARRVVEAAEQNGWDGDWYRRAFFDDGTVVGAAGASECAIDSIVQAWAVLAKTADHARAARAVFASEDMLIDDQSRIMQLLAPPFGQGGPDPGYIAAYPAGVRENGGQYTHGVLFTLRALCELGERARAAHLLDVLNPIMHALTPPDVEHYRVEPYIVAADVCSAPPHRGRGGWTWYTGSAGWFYRIVLEDILGLKKRGETLVFAPCIPPHWSGFELTYRYGRSSLHVTVQSAGGAVTTSGVRLDGRACPSSTVPLIDDGRTHEVVLVLGERRLKSTA